MGFLLTRGPQESIEYEIESTINMNITQKTSK